MKRLIELSELGKNLFTGQLVTNVYKGSVAKVQVARTLKTADLEQVGIKSCL